VAARNRVKNDVYSRQLTANGKLQIAFGGKFYMLSTAK
jgi:hypothetical protein